MVSKVFRIIFISVLLFANAFAYFIAYSPNEPKHLAYIPGNAMMVFSVNTKNIAGSLTYSFLFNQEEFSSLVDQETEGGPDWSKNVNNGLNLFGRMTILMVPGGDGELPASVILSDISSHDRLQSFLQENGGTIEDLDEKNHYSAQGNSAFAFNDEVAVIISGPEKEESKKKLAISILNKTIPSEKEWFSVSDPNDFTMVLKPGIEKMDQAPALKGMIGSFIHSLGLSGNFKEENIDMRYSMTTDPELLADASTVFQMHEHTSDIPQELQEGIFRLQLTFEPARWVEWIKKGDLLNIPDSLEAKLYDGLQSSLGNHFILEVDGCRILRIDTDTNSAAGLKSLPVPDFKAGFELRNPETAKALLEQLRADSLIRPDSGGVYSYTTPFDIDYHFTVIGNTLCMSTTDRYITDPASQFHGFSNYFYFNVSHFIEAIPMESPFGFMIRGVMEEVATVHYGFGYSVGTEANTMKWEGKLFYNDKKKHSLIETVRFLQAVGSMFVGSSETPADEELPEEEISDEAL